MMLNDQDLASLQACLSAERLAALVGLTNSLGDAIVLHQDTLKLGARMMGATATIEIAIRNSVCTALRDHFGTTDWLQSPPGAFSWKQVEAGSIERALQSARRAAYAKLSHTEQSALDAGAFPEGRPTHLSHLNRAIARRSRLSVSESRLITELTLHFWKRLFGPEYEHALWRPCLKRTFPDKSIKRSAIAAHMEVIYQSRNRIAHHEPVLHKRFDDTMTSIKFIAANLGSVSRHPTALSKLLADDVAAIEMAAAHLHARLASFRS